MPESRMPCLATQKIWASVYVVPTIGSCGIGGYKESPKSRLPGVPWHPAHSLRRSEEHTSELQSRQYLVCRLLLEKKKKWQPNPRQFKLQSTTRAALQPARHIQSP